MSRKQREVEIAYGVPVERVPVSEEERAEYDAGPAPDEDCAADGSHEEMVEVQIDPAAHDLQARLDAAIVEMEGHKNQYLRTLADFQNFRRRNEEQMREFRQYASRELIVGLLPILDNFQRALAAAEQNQTYESLVGGVSLTLRQLQELLVKQGVKPIEALGKEFDPTYHEAVVRVEEGDEPENTVVEELQAGYTMHDRVLRPAMVKVRAQG